MRDRIDHALDRFTQFDSDCPPQLRDAIRYAVLAPGKRLRPRLVLLAAEACGGGCEAALPAACAVEMVHAYSLVHDDLPAMDDDDLRRGRPTCHKVYGEATAILVGDALLARSFEVLASEIRPAETAARCCAVLGRAAGASALVGGQAADLQMSSGNEDGNGGLFELQSIHRRKTGALIRASLELGGIVADTSEEELAVLTGYGERVGLAFQITDDLLDVSGDQAAVGKRVAKDADRGKLTFPRLLGCDESRRRAAELVDEACAMIGIFGVRADQLRELAKFVCERGN
ncbi:MAG TPA: farnesyl diphosphate synthase [Lacipirellulaceae bacterium]|jgi:geranylgeranyl diphosphate synthase type II|nr:farnesyl diphosphate synthase [Lacipirellulaceae bacterium]